MEYVIVGYLYRWICPVHKTRVGRPGDAPVGWASLSKAGKYFGERNIGRGVCTAFVCGFYHENYFRAIGPVFKERGSTRFGNTICLGPGKGTILVAL